MSLIGADRSVDSVGFYSYVTGVSLELPVGFERTAEVDHTLTYADLDDPDDPDDLGDPDRDRDRDRPTVQVTLVGLLDDDLRGAVPHARRAAVTALADALAGSGEVLSRTQATVDDEPVETLVVRDADGVELRQLAASSPARLLVVAARNVAAPVFAEAVASIRFIDL